MSNLIIYKYQIELSPSFEVTLREGFVVLAVRVVNDIPYMWVQVNPEAGSEAVEFYVRVTGKEFEPEEDETYVGSFVLSEGEFVGHLYYE